MSIDDYRRWLYDEHFKLINQTNLPIYKRLLIDYSNVTRIGTMKILKLAIDVDPTKTIITTYKASRGDLTVIYGFLYSMKVTDNEQNKKEKDGAFSNKVYHKYV